MLIFNCTQAAQDFFTVTRKGEKQTIVTAPPASDMAEDAKHLSYADGSPARPFQWVLHAVTVKRKNCLVAMEVNTRLSITVTAVKKGDIEHFLAYFRANLLALISGYALAYDVWQPAEAETRENEGLAHLAETRMFRRSDRSVQAHINEVVHILRDAVDETPALFDNTGTLLRFNEFCNNYLRKSRAFPDQDYIVPAEEMLIYWQQQYLNATPEQVADIRQRLADRKRSKYQGIIEDITAKHQSSPQDKPAAADKTQVFFPQAGSVGDADLVFLDEMLAKYATEDSLENASTLHGFLTAIVSAPSMLPPSQWLADIWGGEGLQPAWKNIEEAQRFIGALFSMMNSISRELMESPQTFGAMFTGSYDCPEVADWCFGYTCGVSLDEEAWYEMPDALQDQLDLLDTYALLVEVGSQHLPQRELQERANHVIDAATRLHAYWLKQRTPMMMPANIGKPPPTTQPVVSQKLVGRNDPCPCGSGKKYKKCCLH
ncbi:MAG: UPF0149 family protein [Gammaproteobacteria bacterium]|nr:UPF0149 family protein [Gammaproteobacteria bacterium]MBU1724761.1 UPF0149 family protein [Gammaproteobacteria bacterium]MBU2005768.1 UPF0149 family protein [Gammaproteobacteria bacterium]